MRYILIVSLFVIGCGWGEVPLHSSYDIDVSEFDSDAEQMMVYSEDDYELINNSLITKTIDDVLEDNNYVGFTFVCGECSSVR